MVYVSKCSSYISIILNKVVLSIILIRLLSVWGECVSVSFMSYLRCVSGLN